MKSIVLVILCLAVASQGRVLQPPKEAVDIPVAIVEDKEPPLALALVKEEPKPIVEEAPKEAPKPIVEEAVKEEAIPIIDAPKPLIEEALKTIIEEALKEESKPVVEEASKPILEEPKIQEKLEEIQPKQEIRSLIKEEEIKPEITAEEAKPVIKEEEIKPLISEVEAVKEEPKPVEEPAQAILKALPADDSVVVPAEEVAASPVVEDQADLGDHGQPHLRQATQATPTQQSTTQGNFVQQLIQNSPIGQFLNQFQPQQQQQPAQQAPVQPLAADEAAQPTPAPTIPGFLNPAQAITSAQQVVQNAAQSVVNSTTQAFQGIQQFANNLGSQFTNTLTGLYNPDTTPRPPGPIQQFVSNIFGGGNNATAAAPAQQQQQNQNPLQGIINFLGGNRPQNAPAVVPSPVTEAPAKPEVDDKIDPAGDAVAEFVPESDDQNEVRASGEAIDDSFEEAIPTNEVIVVNDDASDGREVLVDTIVQPQPVAAVDAVAL